MQITVSFLWVFFFLFRYVLYSFLVVLRFFIDFPQQMFNRMTKTINSICSIVVLERIITIIPLLLMTIVFCLGVSEYVSELHHSTIVIGITKVRSNATVTTYFPLPTLLLLFLQTPSSSSSTSSPSLQIPMWTHHQ